MTAATSPLAAELHAAFEWWRMAGVDLEFADDATDWLNSANPADAPPPASTAPQAPEPRVQATRTPEPLPEKNPVERIDLLCETPPQTLAEFREWWMEAPGLDAIGPRGRIASRGPANAELMVLVIDPEESDRDRLLSGPQGRLLSRMLKAMGLDEEQTCIASALPRHTPMADTASLAARGMDAVTAHHIALAAPKRLLAFGGNILPLIGHELPKDAPSLREINQTSASVPVMVSEGLDSVLTMPRLKARFWRRWIEWSVE